MIQLTLLLLSLSFHKACIQYYEGDTSIVTLQTLDKYIRGKYANRTYYYTERYLINDGYRLQDFNPTLQLSADSLNVLDSIWTIYAWRGYYSVLWWGAVRKQRWISFHEACVRTMIGDTSKVVRIRLNKHIRNHHQQVIELMIDAIILRNPDLKISDLSNESLLSLWKEAKYNLVLQEAYKNNYPKPLF